MKATRSRWPWDTVWVSGKYAMIRVFEQADAQAVVDTWFSASVVATPFLTNDFFETERENIRSKWLPLAETWVYEADGEVVGFISLIENEVGALFVRPAWQGRGVGRTLMDLAVDLRGELNLDVFRENDQGRRFYETYGFRKESEHCHEPTGRMQLRLRYAPGQRGDTN